MTVRFGRNTQPNSAADFSFTGGGLDWCNPGAGGTLTIMNSTFESNSAMTGPGGGIDLNTASTTSGTVTMTGVTISNNKSQTPTSGGVSTPGSGGGLSILGGFVYSLNITNSTITGNTAGVQNNPQATDNGGGIYFNPAINAASTAVSVMLHGVTVSNNTAFGGGGVYFSGNGRASFTIDQGSVVSGNTSGGTGGTNSLAAGGGLYLSALDSSTATVTQSTIRNNVLSASTADNRGGAGIFASSGSITVSYNRIVGNTGATAALGTGLRKDANPGVTNAINNWWGCNSGPSAPPCDTATSQGGTLNFNPWLRFMHTVSSSSIVVGQGSTLTVSFLTNSNNQPIAASNLTALVGVPVTFNNAVKGTISNAQTTIQSTGTATATFTGTSPGAGSANAAVDNGTITVNITIAQAATTAAVTSNVNPSVSNQTVTLTATVSVTAPGSGTPTGTVQFRDNGNAIAGCTSVALTGGQAQCMTSALTIGSHTITAVYSGDTNFTGSTSPNFTQTVGKANTTTTITNDMPDPSVVGQAYAVTASVAVNSPGSSTPTGTITISDGSQTCAITLPATNCNLTSMTAGAKTLTATYNGDANFNASPASAGVAHTVNNVPTAAAVEISGRVMTQTGRGINNARVTIIDQSGDSRTATTNTLGYFRFTKVQAGETYIISVSLKRYTFTPQVVNLNEELTDLNFTAVYQDRRIKL